MQDNVPLEDAAGISQRKVDEYIHLQQKLEEREGESHDKNMTPQAQIIYHRTPYITAITGHVGGAIS